MGLKQRIFFTVTNDLVYDQRMQRICSSMATAGYQVTLVGRLMPQSPPLLEMDFQQVRLPMRYSKGKLFYLEYNFKLYRYLMRQPMDAICAIDLDTIVPVLLASKKRGLPRMYDAHEYFTEMIEVKRRPWIYAIWKRIEKWAVPQFKHGYTVGQFIAAELESSYGVRYALVRNMSRFKMPIDSSLPFPPRLKALLQKAHEQTDSNLPFFLYQGALNEGRSLPSLLQAMESVPARLFLAGSGNMEQQVKALIERLNLHHKVVMLGNVPPMELYYITSYCYAGITIFDNASLNQYYSLGNKFFDILMARKPQVCVNYPEYAAILKQYPVALPIADTAPKTIADALNKLLTNHVLYTEMQNAATDAATRLNWQNEEQVLLHCWQRLLNDSFKETN